MEKYNIDYIVNTPDGRTEQLPNSPYPVQSENLETVMAQLSNGLPGVVRASWELLGDDYAI